MTELTLSIITLAMLFKWPRFTIATIAAGCLMYAVCVALDIIPIKESSTHETQCYRAFEYQRCVES